MRKRSALTWPTWSGRSSPRTSSRGGRRRDLALFALLLPGWLAAQEGEPASSSSEVPIYVMVEPATAPAGPGGLSSPMTILKTLPGVALKIHGVAARDLAGTTLEIRVTPPQQPEPPEGPEAESECPDDDETEVVAKGRLKPEPPTVLRVAVSTSGTFETSFTPQATGEHEVVVSEASGRYRGQTSFEVEELEQPKTCPEDLRREVEAEAKQLVDNLHALTRAVCTRQEELPASPARDEATQKCKKLDEALKEELPAGEAPPWIHAADHLADLRSRHGPEVRRATDGLVSQLTNWKAEAAQANAKASRALAEVTKGNVICDQLDVVINGLKFCDFYLGLVTTPGKLFVDWAKENVPTKLVGMLPAVKRTTAGTQAIESSWKGILTFAPTKAKITGDDLMPAGTREGYTHSVDKGREFARGSQTMLFDLSQFVANRFFEKYCQQFQGPILGTMQVEFYDSGVTWWKYKTDIQGELILRYPKGATGDAIALTGEFMGNAMKFKSWDRAIPVLFPKLAMGTVFREIRNEPMGLADLVFLGDSKFKDAKIGGQELPSFNPLTSMIDKGGPAVKNLVTPAFFKVPVRGDLRGNTLRLELQNAVVDFDDARVKVVQIMLPVVSLWPTVNDYALPYKGARFILFRAMDDGPVEFQVNRLGKTMFIERTFHRERRTAENKGVYDLSIKACNPSCSGSGAPAPPPSAM